MKTFSRSKRAGFTLAEAAVTIALVAITLTVLLQSMEGSKLLAAYTRDVKTARELALGTLAEIEAGWWQDELDFTREGDFSTYGEGEYSHFTWELAIGDESFAEDNDDDEEGLFDNWAHNREVELDNMTDAELDEEEEATEPFEKVRIKVGFPRYGDFNSTLTLERWIPWEQVYGSDDEDEEGGGPADPGLGPPPGEGNG